MSDDILLHENVVWNPHPTKQNVHGAIFTLNVDKKLVDRAKVHIYASQMKIFISATTCEYQTCNIVFIKKILCGRQGGFIKNDLYIFFISSSSEGQYRISFYFDYVDSNRRRGHKVYVHQYDKYIIGIVNFTNQSIIVLQKTLENISPICENFYCRNHQGTFH